MCGAIGSRYINFTLGWCTPVKNMPPAHGIKNNGFLKDTT